MVKIITDCKNGPRGGYTCPFVGSRKARVRMLLRPGSFCVHQMDEIKEASELPLPFSQPRPGWGLQVEKAKAEDVSQGLTIWVP